MSNIRSAKASTLPVPAVLATLAALISHPVLTLRHSRLRIADGGPLSAFFRPSALGLRVSFLSLLLLCAVLPGAWAQLSSEKVTKVQIKHLGPATVSDELIRANIRVKAGDTYLPAAVDEDVRNLYATGLFYNIQVTSETTPQGIALTYVVQSNPRIVEVKFIGNKKYKNSKLQKKITSKVGEPFNERKLFTDTQEIKNMYQKAGYPRTEVKYSFSIDENTGRATVTFDIKESPKVKIAEVDFVNAKAFTQRQLRKAIKTRKHWMFSWLTGSGFLKDDQFADDKEALVEYYRDHGYLDFEIKDVQFLYPTPKTMVIKFIVYEGTQYKVGAIKFTGNKLFATPQLTNGLRQVELLKNPKAKLGPTGLPMDLGDTFTPKGLRDDTEAVEDFYGSRGYIDVTGGSRNLNVVRVPNTDTGTMDLEFQIQEGEKSYVEKIQIRGNTKTKDKVIRRELAISPGETFDMVRVKRSKQRLEGLNYFEKVDARPEPTVVPNRKDLVIGVDEKNTGNLTLGAGFSSVDAVVGFVELSQGNFDLFHPPTFTGGGQKFRLRAAIGTQQQDYLISFIEPWFLGYKLALGVDLYYRDLAYLSVNNLYDVTRLGTRVSLTRALGSDFLIGSVSAGVEDVGIHLTSSAILPSVTSTPNPLGAPTLGENPGNVPPSIRNEVGYNLLGRFGSSLAYDTRNSVKLPDKGQRTEIDAEVVTADRQFYKLELKSGWYFKGLAKGHVLELSGRTGIAESLQGGNVPFYERYYLGGLYSMRGFKFHNVAPRDANGQGGFYDEPVGGDSYWFGSAEYSIPIFEQEHGVGVRFALFYDIGNVSVDPYSWEFSNYSDNYGVGLRLNLPIGPIRLDYGIPIHHDQFNSSSGQFQFGVGYTREF